MQHGFLLYRLIRDIMTYQKVTAGTVRGTWTMPLRSWSVSLDGSSASSPAGPQKSS